MKSLTLSSYVFALVGVAMLIGALFWWMNIHTFLADASRTQGTVIALRARHSNNDTTYSPVVAFQLQTQRIEFDSASGSNPPHYQVGETVPVVYPPSNPYQAKIDSFFSLWGGAVILAGLGSLFFVVGAAIIVAPRLQKRGDDRLMHEGVPVQADFQQVDRNTEVTVNGRNPFRIVCQWQDPTTTQVHVFESHNVWFDPSKYIQQKEIRVFIDRSNPKRYYVDLSFLPKFAD